MSPVKCVGLLLCVLLARNSAAHEHHSDKIPEGEAISAEPIVRAVHLKEKAEI